MTSLATKNAMNPIHEAEKQDTPSYLAGQVAAEVMAGSMTAFGVAEATTSTAM